MKVVAIRFSDGTYYAGCTKTYSKTLLGAQLYKSRKTAENIVNTSINFPKYHSNPITIVDVELNEIVLDQSSTKYIETNYVLDLLNHVKDLERRITLDDIVNIIKKIKNNTH